MITNKSAVRWCSEQVRPVSEMLRDLKVRLDDLNRNWNTKMSPLVPNSDAETFEDGAPDNGWTPMHGQDAWLFVAQVQALISLLDGAGVMDVVTKPNRRFLNIDPVQF